MKHKCVNKFFGRSAVWADLTNKLTNSSRNGLLYVQVVYKYLSFTSEFTSAFTSAHINVLCLTVILTVKLFSNYIVASRLPQTIGKSA